MMARVVSAKNRTVGSGVLALLAIAAVLVALPLSSAVAVIGGALCVVAILRFPELALYALILAVPYGFLFPIPLGAGNLTAVDVLVAVVLVLWLVGMVMRDRAIRIRWAPLSAPFAFFLGAALFSVVNALSLEHAIVELVKWLEIFVIYICTANTLGAAGRARVLAVLLLAGLSQAVLGIYQFLFRMGPEGFALFGRFMRAAGTFEQPNPYAGYLGLLIPIALGVLVGALNINNARSPAGTKNGASGTSRWTITFLITRFGLVALSAIALVAMLAGVLMSWSRGAWLGVAAGLITVVVLQSRRALVLCLIAAFILTFAILLSSINIIPTEIAERFSGIGDYFGVFDVRGVKVDDTNFAIVERMAHWQAAWEMWLAHLLFGVGFGNYEVAYPAYALPRWSDPLGHAHNYYLNAAAEVGSIGLFAYLVLWAAAVWQGWQALRSSAGIEHSIAAGLLGMLVVLSIHNGFDNLFVHGIGVQIGIGLGLAAAIADSWQAPTIPDRDILAE